MDNVTLGVVDAEYDPRETYGFVDFAERNGRIFFHRSNVIGQALTPAAPVTFVIGRQPDRAGRGRPCALEIRRLCPFDYRAGDALETEQPAGDDAAGEGGGQDGELLGLVVSFDAAKGYGHIRQSDGRHIFFHVSNVIAGKGVLVPGDCVAFNLGMGIDSKGIARWQAVGVKRCMAPIN